MTYCQINRIFIDNLVSDLIQTRTISELLEPMELLSDNPDQQIKEILEIFNLSSIDELLQFQILSVKKLAERTKINQIFIQELLYKLHQNILITQLLDKKVPPTPPLQQKVIQLSKIFPQINECIEEGELLEVLGRANAGKTTFMIECIKQALHKDMQPIVLSSSSNCTQQYLQQFGYQKLMIFQFTQIGDLAMTIHALSQQILQKYSQEKQRNMPHCKFIVFIDCLSEIEKDQENKQFGCSEKFRRLINSIATRTQTSVVYTYRVNFSLFPTQFKKDYHRPKCRNTKEWDGWTNKNIMVDYVIRKKDKKSVVRVMFPKSYDNKMHEFIIDKN